ncbi:glycoside hydrolase family 9 protein [Bacillus licheniformis]|nr:glycoside hydrolase family 9 protein [Bacillus licheniformis]
MDTEKRKISGFAVRQTEYMLGDNPQQRSFVVGYGKIRRNIRITVQHTVHGPIR